MIVGNWSCAKSVKDYSKGSVMFVKGEVALISVAYPDTVDVFQMKTNIKVSVPKSFLEPYGLMIFPYSCYDDLNGKCIKSMGDYTPSRFHTDRIPISKDDHVLVRYRGVDNNSNYLFVRKLDSSVEGFAPYNFFDPNPIDEDRVGFLLFSPETKATNENDRKEKSPASIKK